MAINQLADGRLLSVVLKMRPTRFLRHPEHVLGEILIRVLGGGGVFRLQRCTLRFEGIGNVLEKNQAKCDVLVIRWFEVLAQLVGGEESYASKPRLAPFPFAFCGLAALASVPSSAAVFRPRGIIAPCASGLRSFPHMCGF